VKILYIEDYKNIHDMTLDILRDIEPDAEIVSYHDVPDCSELSDDTDYIGDRWHRYKMFIK